MKTHKCPKCKQTVKLAITAATVRCTYCHRDMKPVKGASKTRARGATRVAVVSRRYHGA